VEKVKIDDVQLAGRGTHVGIVDSSFPLSRLRNVGLNLNDGVDGDSIVCFMRNRTVGESFSH